MVDVDSIKPTGSNVLIRRTPSAAATSAIIAIPETSKYCDKVVADVVAAGLGEYLNNGEREFMGVVAGDKVLSWPGHGHPIGDNYWIVDISEIEAVVRE